MKIKKQLSFIILFTTFSFVYAQTANLSSSQQKAEIVDSGLTPSSTFYFLDKFVEQLDLFLTFNKSEKAKLQVNFAKERIAEIKTMVETGVTEKVYIDSAKIDAKDNIASANVILAEEKNKGVDTKELELDLDDYDSVKDDFESYIENKAKAMEVEHEALSKQLDSKTLTNEQKQELKNKIKIIEEEKSRLDEVEENEELGDDLDFEEDEENDDGDDILEDEEDSNRLNSSTTKHVEDRDSDRDRR